MPPSLPGDSGAEDPRSEDLVGHDAEFRPPLPPDDRIWRHPSEVAAAARARPTETRRSSRAPIGTVALSALIGATLSLGIVAALGGFDTRVVERRVAVDPPAGVTGSSPLATLTRDTVPSVVGLVVGSGDGSTEANAVILRSDGYLLTTAAIVESAEWVDAHFPDGEILSASVVGADPVTDVAVLRVDRDRLTPAVVGSDGELEVGEEIMAIGTVADGGWEPVLTTCVVSAVGRSITRGGDTLHDMVLIDRALPDQLAGSPVVDTRGAVIGLLSSFGPGVDDGELRMPVVPIDTAVGVADEIMDVGHARHVWLGVGGHDLDRAAAGKVGLPGGAAVSTVLPDSPAERAGLIDGDIITGIDDVAVRSMSDLVIALRSYEPGERLTVHVSRDGEEITVDAELEERPARDA